MKKKYPCLVIIILAVLISVTGCFGSTPGSSNFETQAEAKVPSGFDKGITLEAALKDKKPVLVKFYADWCGACQRAAPVFASVREDYADKMTFVMVNVDRNSALSNSFNVMFLPTLYLIDPVTSSKIEVPSNYIYDKNSLEAFLKANSDKLK